MIITITGKPCSGKSTIAKLLAEQYDFKRIGVGEMFKEEAKRLGVSSEEFNKMCLSDPSFDYKLDQQSAILGEKLEGQKYIFDSRLAWHFVPKSFKVFVDIDEEEMVKRLVNSDRQGKEKYSTITEAKITLKNRQNLEIERYKKIYNIDLSDLNNFDFVIDSTNKTPQQLTDEIWEAYQLFCKQKRD